MSRACGGGCCIGRGGCSWLRHRISNEFAGTCATLALGASLEFAWNVFGLGDSNSVCDELEFSVWPRVVWTRCVLVMVRTPPHRISNEIEVSCGGSESRNPRMVVGGKTVSSARTGVCRSEWGSRLVSVVLVSSSGLVCRFQRGVELPYLNSGCRKYIWTVFGRCVVYVCPFFFFFFLPRTLVI